MSEREGVTTAEEKFARRSALFQWRRPSGTAAWMATGANVAAIAAYIALSEAAHWPAWAAIGTGIAIWIAGHIIADRWPRPVPPELAGEVARLQAGEATLCRRHPFWCTEKDPHVHMTIRGTPVLVVWRGESPPAQPGTHWIRSGRKAIVVVERWRETADQPGPGQ